MELHLLKASMASRDAAMLILEYINQKEYSREFTIVINKIKEYYKRDADVRSVNRDIFVSMLAESVTNDKHLKRFTTLLDQALLMDTSVANLTQLIIDTKKHEVGLRLSAALANKDDKADALIEEYKRLESVVTLEDLDGGGVEILTHEDAERLLEYELSGEGKLKVYPLALNERLMGRAAGGHSIIFFARPEMGKTAFVVTAGSGFARQDKPGIIVINEDRTEDTYLRTVSCLSGLTYKECLMDPNRAVRLARDRGLGHITFISATPGTPKLLHSYVEKLKAEWIIIDQVRNLDVKEQNKVIQLEKAAQAQREVAKKHGVLAIGTTQAGDSAEGKRLLTMGDVDFSNTGVPAACDVLAGMGGTEDDVSRGTRFMNLSKNKIGARHESFPLQLNAPLSRLLSVGEQVEVAAV